MVELADAELVARSRRRDPDAFGVLVERHQQLVFGVALARCQDPALAEDLAQEAFVTAWRDLDRLRDTERVGSWVAGIARNLASSAVRDRARHKDAPEQAPGHVPTPEDEALEREDRELLQRALADVPDAHRETLVLFYMEGESVAEIAAVLGIREDLVKQRLSRGRKSLRDSVAARVESALTRVRLRPAFRVGVVAALSAVGTREAAAAGATGKVLAFMSVKKLAVVAVAVLAVAGGAIWLGVRARAGDPREVTSAAPGTNSAGTGASTTGRRDPTASDPAAPARPKVERLTDKQARVALLEAIRTSQSRRTAATAGHAPSSTSTTPPPALPETPIDKQYIRSAVREIIPLLADCYGEGLMRDPKLGAGDVVVDFTIEGEPDVGGLVGESKIDAAKTNIADPAVLECIQETMYALKIDPPPGGGVVRVHYPFKFSPAPPPGQDAPK